MRGTSETSADWLVGSGEMGQLIRSKDWRKSAVGPIEEWPQSLRHSLRLCLDCDMPLSILWGPDHLQFYNDAYRNLLGLHHAELLGHPASASWPEKWNIASPMAQSALISGRPTHSTNRQLFLRRKRQLEEAYFTLYYSPIQDLHGRTVGVMEAVFETTQQVLRERRLRVLRDLMRGESGAGSADQVAERIAVATSRHAPDVPFALIYRTAGGHTAHLSGACGLEPGEPAAPRVVDLKTSRPGWPLAEAVASGEVVLVDRLQSRFPHLHVGPWPEGSSSALVYPLLGHPNRRPLGVAVFGISARLELDDSYREFFNEAAAEVARAMNDAEALRHEREANESCQVLVEAAAQAVWETDPKGAVVEDSPSWRSYTGQTMEEFSGMGWLDAVHPEDRQNAQQWWQQTISERRSSESEFRLRHAGNGWRWAHVQAAPIPDKQGEVRKWVGMNVDISDRKFAEEALNEAHQRKDHFLAMLGHELRNPLAAISMAINVLRNDPTPERRRWTDDIVERQVGHLRRLVDDLIDVSRITRGKIELQEELLDVGHHMLTAAEAVETAIAERHLHLAVLPPRAPVRVRADALRLQQMFTNLLTNAAKYTPDGGEIRFCAELMDEHVLIRCKDNGIGIPPEALTSIFEPFSQLDTELHRGGTGLGIGLALVKSLVERHGGSVWAASEGPGMGSEFTLRLPIAAMHASGKAPQATAVHPRSPSGNRRRILIAEDNVDLAETLKVVLETAGHQVRVRHDGIACLTAARTSIPDVMIIDVDLPGRNGYAVVEAIRRMPGFNQVLLIGMSGYREEKDSEGGTFDRYLVKPIEPDELLQIVEQDVQRTRAETSRQFSRILIVEDHPALGNTMQQMLQTRGYETALAPDGESAIEQAPVFQPDVVLCDLRLPGMHGTSVARQLRQLPGVQDGFFVALSADNVNGMEAELKSAGFDRSVTKPLMPAQLEELLLRHGNRPGRDSNPHAPV